MPKGTDPGGPDPEGRKPIQDKSELVEELTGEIDEIKEFCMNLDVDLTHIDAADTGSLERVRLITDAANRILVNDETKRDYLQRVSQISRLYKGNPPPIPRRVVSIASVPLINIIAQKIKNLHHRRPIPPM